MHFSSSYCFKFKNLLNNKGKCCRREWKWLERNSCLSGILSVWNGLLSCSWPWGFCYLSDTGRKCWVCSSITARSIRHGSLSFRQQVTPIFLIRTLHVLYSENFFLRHFNVSHWEDRSTAISWTCIAVKFFGLCNVRYKTLGVK